MLTSIVGINWGDEGKGRMVDLLSQKYDVVVRYQGGNNAGHTVINDKGKFVLNLMPSGILRDETVNVLGPGMVIDTEHMFHEVARLREGGITITPEHLKISDKAVICMPYHKLLDCLEEDRLADKKFGSTRRGISPAYSDKYMKKALRMGELADRDALKARLADILEWKNLFIVNGYHHDPIDLDEMMDWLDTYAMPFKDYVCDTTDYLTDAIEDNKSLLFEAQLGALRDIDYGIYPYTSGSSTIAAYAPIGAGVPIVGGFLSGGFDLALAGSALIKNSVGYLGMLLLLAVLLKPLAMLISVNVLLKFTAAVTQPLGDRRISDFLGETADNANYCLAGVLMTAFMYFVMLLLCVCCSEATI